MSYEKLEEDLIRQGMELTVYAADPSLRYKRGWSWFLSEESCKHDMLYIALRKKATVSDVRMAEGLVARHLPNYRLVREELMYSAYVVFVQR